MKKYSRTLRQALIWTGFMLLWAAGPLTADDGSLALPQDQTALFHFPGFELGGQAILSVGLAICALGVAFGIREFLKLRALPAHTEMLHISQLIYATCRTYLLQQGKLLLGLQALIGATIVYYFGFLKANPPGTVLLILMWSLVGIAGSFLVAWFGILINNIANSRTAFAALRGLALPIHEIPTRAGMSIGVLLISIELFVMICVLKFVDPALAGACFIGFAIGESLGASVLRICGGMFTKIADIGSDMMKIVFRIEEDDARNPGVIADCAGDNAGDSVGPTADGFETYGVTGVALITFILLAVAPEYQWMFIIWIFTMRILMVPASILAWAVNGRLVRRIYRGSRSFNFEHPLTSLVWLTSLLCVAVSYCISYTILHAEFGALWWKLPTIISCGTIAAAVIPEITRVLTSTKSAHCHEVVNATSEGGAGLTILSGLIAGNFSCFWKGSAIVLLMLIAYVTSLGTLSDYMAYPAIFALGLVAFGMLGMGPVTIAVDSYGPVADNAQSVFELSRIDKIATASEYIEAEFGFKPDFAHGKHLLEDNDGAGNTFKATAKPMLIGTAVVGATTMIFSLILLMKGHYGWDSFAKLSIVEVPVMLGIIMGGAVVYWFMGASRQAVTTGAYRAVDFIKQNIRLTGVTRASMEDSNAVVRICTRYAQQGMINVFGALFCLTLAFACIDPVFFSAYLLAIAFFGLFSAINMANAGACWDNAKKIVEVDLRKKGTDLHAAMVIGDLVGDPFKDTSSVALNPVIKFTTLFGILAVEIAINSPQIASLSFSVAFLIAGLWFVARSFYGMRISNSHPRDHIASVEKRKLAAERAGLSTRSHQYALLVHPSRAGRS